MDVGGNRKFIWSAEYFLSLREINFIFLYPFIMFII